MISQLEQSANTHATWADRQLLTWKVIQREIPFDFVAICFDNPGKKEPVLSSFLRIGFNEYQSIGMNELSTITGTGKNDLTRMIHQPDKKTITGYFNEDMFEEIALKRSLHALLQEKFEMQSLLSLTFTTNSGEPCSLYFYSRRADTYNADHVAMLFRLQKTFASILEPSVVEKTNGTAKPPTAVNEIISANASGFENIIGNSHLLLNVFDQVKQVAPFDTSVLILGESGTGKERIADCIHNLSPRKGKALIKVNCAALPATLVESELFGHEKGSFTGAIDKRVGKFEQAHGGTIFLDEVGEMSVDLQVKLLRVLQEKEIEPVGGRSPVKIDVRVITATNRNLEKEVAEGRFRLDLYYRLNVFPISMPSLSERIDDIPVLVQHFINIYNRKSGKKITGVADKLLNKLMAYSWPGNIRELENLVERSVLLAKGTTIEDISLPTTLGNNSQRKVPEAASKTIHENERDYIINVLKKCNGKIWGLGGAASILNVPPSTLKSKMKKLGILKVNNE